MKCQFTKLTCSGAKFRQRKSPERWCCFKLVRPFSHKGFIHTTAGTCWNKMNHLNVPNPAPCLFVPTMATPFPITFFSGSSRWMTLQNYITENSLLGSPKSPMRMVDTLNLCWLISLWSAHDIPVTPDTRVLLPEIWGLSPFFTTANTPATPFGYHRSITGPGVGHVASVDVWFSTGAKLVISTRVVFLSHLFEPVWVVQ